MSSMPKPSMTACEKDGSIVLRTERQGPNFQIDLAVFKRSFTNQCLVLQHC